MGIEPGTLPSSRSYELCNSSPSSLSSVLSHFRKVEVQKTNNHTASANSRNTYPSIGRMHGNHHSAKNTTIIHVLSPSQPTPSQIASNEFPETTHPKQAPRSITRPDLGSLPARLVAQPHDSRHVFFGLVAESPSIDGLISIEDLRAQHGSKSKDVWGLLILNHDNASNASPWQNARKTIRCQARNLERIRAAGNNQLHCSPSF